MRTRRVHALYPLWRQHAVLLQLACELLSSPHYTYTVRSSAFPLASLGGQGGPNVFFLPRNMAL